MGGLFAKSEGPFCPSGVKASKYTVSKNARHMLQLNISEVQLCLSRRWQQL